MGAQNPSGIRGQAEWHSELRSGWTEEIYFIYTVVHEKEKEVHSILGETLREHKQAGPTYDPSTWEANARGI